MNIDNFIENFAGEFDETPVEAFVPTTEFKPLKSGIPLQLFLLFP